MVKPNCIIVDLDGTLCNVDHRRHLVQCDKPDWTTFNDTCDKDPVNEWCAGIVNSYWTHMSIVLVSGRSREYEEKTKKWLLDNKISYSYLHMRPAGDRRPDEVVKKEIYEKHIQPFFDVVFCIDDRTKIVKMWRSLGLVCLQCSDWEEYERSST